MTNHPGIRAGIIGAAVSVVLSLLALIPFFGCLLLPVSLIVYFGVGALAALFVVRRRPRASRQLIAQSGFLAGLITGLADALLGLAMTPLALWLTGGSEAILLQLPSSLADLIGSLGLTPAEVFSSSGIFVLAALLAIFTVVLATLLGVLGSILYSAAPGRRWPI